MISITPGLTETLDPSWSFDSPQTTYLTTKFPKNLCRLPYHAFYRSATPPSTCDHRSMWTSPSHASNPPRTSLHSCCRWASDTNRSRAYCYLTIRLWTLCHHSKCKFPGLASYCWPSCLDIWSSLAIYKHRNHSFFPVRTSLKTQNHPATFPHLIHGIHHFAIGRDKSSITL